jgi:starch phosphorylase
VQLVHGKTNGEDELSDTRIDTLTVAESYDGGRHRLDGEVPLDHSGAFGYTVRIIPRHDLLVSDAELGVVAMA